MAGSTVPSAIRNLLDALEAVDATAWAGHAPPAIELGIDGDSTEMVTLGIVDGDEEWVALGSNKRDEQFDVDLFVIVRTPGLTPLEALDRAWHLWGVVDDAITARAQELAQSSGAMWAQMKRPRGVPTVEGTEGAGYVVQSAVRFRARRSTTP